MAALLDLSRRREENTAGYELIVNSTYSRYSKRALISQKICSISENRTKLWRPFNWCPKNINNNTNEGEKHRIIDLSIWDLLTAGAIGNDGKEHTMSFLRFCDALEAFFYCFECMGLPYLNTDEDKFQYDLLREHWCLSVSIITHEKN